MKYGSYGWTTNYLISGRENYFFQVVIVTIDSIASMIYTKILMVFKWFVNVYESFDSSFNGSVPISWFRRKLPLFLFHFLLYICTCICVHKILNSKNIQISCNSDLQGMALRALNNYRYMMNTTSNYNLPILKISYSYLW